MACVAIAPAPLYARAQHSASPPATWQLVLEKLLEDVSEVLESGTGEACSAPGEDIGLRTPKALPLPCARSPARDDNESLNWSADLPECARRSVNELPVAVGRRREEKNGGDSDVDFGSAHGVREHKGGKKKGAKKAVPLSLAPTNNSGGDENGDAPPAEGGGDGGSGAGDAGGGGDDDWGNGWDSGKKSKKQEEEEAEKAAKEKEEEEKKAAEASAANNLSWADDADVDDDGWFNPGGAKKKKPKVRGIYLYQNLNLNLAKTNFHPGRTCRWLPRCQS